MRTITLLKHRQEYSSLQRKDDWVYEEAGQKYIVVRFNVPQGVSTTDYKKLAQQKRRELLTIYKKERKFGYLRNEETKKAYREGEGI